MCVMHLFAGGACGYGIDVTSPPFNAIVSAGSKNLFQSGKGCGACYQVMIELVVKFNKDNMIN